MDTFEDTEKVFSEMTADKIPPNLDTFKLIFSKFVENGKLATFLEEMSKSNVSPDAKLLYDVIVSIPVEDFSTMLLVIGQFIEKSAAGEDVLRNSDVAEAITNSLHSHFVNLWMETEQSWNGCIPPSSNPVFSHFFIAYSERVGEVEQLYVRDDLIILAREVFQVWKKRFVVRVALESHANVQMLIEK